MMPPWLNTAMRPPGVGGRRCGRARRAPGRGSTLGDSAPGIDVPALLGEHLEGDRVALGHVLAVQLALPLAEVDLAQVGLDDRLEAEPGGERRGGLRPCGAAT